MSEFASARTPVAFAAGDVDAAHSGVYGGANYGDSTNLNGLPHLRTSHYGKERKVFEQGEPATSIFQIESGAVMILQEDNRSRRRLLEVLGTGCFFGVTGGPLYDCQALTMVPTVLRQISRAHVEQAADLKSRIVEQRVRHLEKLRTYALTMTSKSALERVATFLWHLPDAEGSTGALPRAVRATPNQQDMSSFLGLSAETVCRSMRRLQKENVVCGAGRTRIVIIDENRLAHLAGEDHGTARQ